MSRLARIVHPDMPHHSVLNKKVCVTEILLIAVVGLLVYANALGNSFLWDDRCLVVENSYIKSWHYLPRIFSKDLLHAVGESSNYYRPFQTLSYMVDYSIWRLRPLGYHITNLLFHIFNAFLVYILVNLVSKDRKISLITGLLFVIHPVHTAAVAYISGRADLLVAFFSLLSIYLFIWGQTLPPHYNPSGSDPLSPMKRAFCYVGSLLFFILALLSKEIALILPLTVVVYDRVFMDRTPSLRERDRIVKRYLAYFVIAVVYILLRATLLNFADRLIPESQTPLYLRLLTMCKVIVIYIRLLFLPFGLHMEWDIQPIISFFDIRFLASFSFLVLIWAFIIKAYRRSKPLFFASLWFFILLIPASNLVPLTTYLAEHWLYLPSIGFFMVIATGIVRARGLKVGRYRLICWWIATFYFGLTLIFYSGLTVKRNTDWTDELTIYHHTLHYSPDNYHVHNNLGVAYKERGLLDEAMKEFKEALRIKPDFAEAYSNCGVVYMRKGMFDEALDYTRKALKLRPHFANAHNNLAAIYEKKGLLEEAGAEYKEALRISPEIPKFHNNLGLLYEKQGLFGQATTQYKEALRLDPGFVDAHKNLVEIQQKLLELQKLGF